MAFHTVYTSNEQRDQDNITARLEASRSYEAAHRAWMDSPEREQTRIANITRRASKIRNAAERRAFLRSHSITPPVFLSLSPAIITEWSARCIADVIPALSSWSGAAQIEVSEQTAAEIAADCRFYINPKAVDASPAERAAYRGLLRQIEKQTA